MIDLAKQASLKDQASNYLQSEDFKKLVPYLMSGGAGALIGGAVTGRRREEKGEGRLGYLGRILRNAVITGGLAGGAHYLLGKGTEKTIGNLSDSSKAISGTAGDEGPAATAAKNILFSPLTAAGAGAGTLALTHNNSIIGAGNKAPFLKRFGDMVGKGTSWLETATPDEAAAAVKKLAPSEIATAERLRRRAGVPSSLIEDGGSGIGNLMQKIPGMGNGRAEAVKGAISTLGRRGLSTLGQTHTRRAMRGALGLTAASLPALIGALVTSKSTPTE